MKIDQDISPALRTAIDKVSCPGPRPPDIIFDIAKAIARRLAREEYDRGRVTAAGSDAPVRETGPAMRD